MTPADLPRSMKLFWFRTLLFLATLAAGLCLVEAALRLADRTGRNSYAIDRVAWRYRPAPARLHPWTQPGGPVLRLAVIGDSFTAGGGIFPEDRYAAQLERLLNFNEGTPPGEVIVLAESGTATYQQVPLLKQALETRPDLVLLGLCLNDTEHTARSRQLAEWRSTMWPPRPPDWLHPLLRHSRLLRAGYQRLGQPAARRGFQEYYRRIYDPEYSGWKLFREALAEFQRRCAEQNTPLRVCIFPLFSHDLRTGQYPFERYHLQIRQALQELGIAHLDLYERVFKDMDHYRLEAYPRVDPHPNEIAHRLIASALFEYLLEENLIDPAYRPIAKVPGDALERRWELIRRRLDDPLATRPDTDE
jgi:lysophospholipase L1-like esterase